LNFPSLMIQLLNQLFHWPDGKRSAFSNNPFCKVSIPWIVLEEKYISKSEQSDLRMYHNGMYSINIIKTTLSLFESVLIWSLIFIISCPCISIYLRDSRVFSFGCSVFLASPVWVTSFFLFCYFCMLIRLYNLVIYK
jgi:hypothetical protein